MKLQLKLAIYNSLSKAVILLAFGAFLPMLVERIVYDHIDQRLEARLQKVLKIIEKGGLNDIALEQDCSFESYNILKEEFIKIAPLTSTAQVKPAQIINEEWDIEGDHLNHRIIRQSFMYDNQLYELNIGEGISSVEQLKNTISKFALWATIIVIIISVFIDIAFARLTLRPFNEILEKKLRLTKDPVQYDFSEVKTSTQEFKALDNNLNSLMQRIKDAFLIEKEFITNVSHELQTPISILKTRFENMLTDESVPDDVADKLEDSIRKLNRMSKIIKSLLMISKIENEQFLKNEQVDINTLLNEILEELNERFQSKNILLHTNLTEEYVCLNANRSLLYTLFSNLIINAIKYNLHGGSVTVSTKFLNGKYQVEITDTGKGITKENLPLIFERFKRFNNADEPSYGLGLAIVKTIADFHRIHVNVFSETDKGSTFTVTFNGQ